MIDRDSLEPVRVYAYKEASKGRQGLPRFFRKMIANSKFHRAWLQGQTGSFLMPVMERI